MYWLDAGTTLFKIVYETASYSFLLACCFSYAIKAQVLERVIRDAGIKEASSYVHVGTAAPNRGACKSKQFWMA